MVVSEIVSFHCWTIFLQLVSPEVYEQHLAKSVTEAENKIGNAFHCKTPDCPGWCIFEDNVNTFQCPVCNEINCLTCQVLIDLRCLPLFLFSAVIYHMC